MFIPEILKKMLLAISPPPYVVKMQKTEDGIDGRLVTYVDRDCYISEQYKVLRTNLYSISTGKPIKALMITSTEAEEGKTLTSCNLAFALSLDKEKRVLLADADLRRPAVHNIFGIPKKPGFSDILSGEADIESFLQKEAIGNLFIIPAGSERTNPFEILVSTKIKDVIDKLRLNFDYIILDTPPVLNVTDSSILGSLCDAVILVVKAGATQRSMIEEAFIMLEGAQARPKACILTNVHPLLEPYHSYYKYKYSRSQCKV